MGNVGQLSQDSKQGLELWMVEVVESMVVDNEGQEIPDSTLLELSLELVWELLVGDNVDQGILDNILAE